MFRRDWGETDVLLSPKGHEQCQRAHHMLTSLLVAIRNLEKQERTRGEDRTRPFCVDAFLVSPLTRALQTAANTMHGIDRHWHCAPSEGTEGSIGASRRKNPTWLVDSLLREKMSTRGDVGTETHTLRERLLDLHSKGKLQSSTFDFGLLPERSKWWVPHTADQLEAMVERFSASNTCDSCWSDTASTTASETEEQAVDTLLRLGSSPRHPLSAAENSIKNTFDLAESPAHEPHAVYRRMAVWKARNSKLPIYQTVPSESNQLLHLRAKLLLSILCRAEGADTMFIVTHSLFLKVLTGTEKFANAEIRAFLLVCDGTPKLVPL